MPQGAQRLFVERHIGPSDRDIEEMLQVVGSYNTLDELSTATVPPDIYFHGVLDLPQAVPEDEALAQLMQIADENQVNWLTVIGQGYHGTFVPTVIERMVLQDPRWYSGYTPYQAATAQGRLEATLNYQTMAADLTGMDIAGSSLLDEGTALAEAMTMATRLVNDRHSQSRRNVFFVSRDCHPQNVDVVQTRAKALDITVIVGDHRTYVPNGDCIGVAVQYPNTYGDIVDYREFFDRVHKNGGMCVVATDLLALVLLQPPGEFGADIVVGSTQRFGVPLGFGGPHAAFLATRDEYKRQMPGRLVGVTTDARGKRALRLALATREQHIRREKATSNICTAQVLLAVMASMYAVYHGPAGLRQIAQRVHCLTRHLAIALCEAGATVNNAPVFDTLRVSDIDVVAVRTVAETARINLRYIDSTSIGISLDETTKLEDLWRIIALFSEEVAERFRTQYPTLDTLFDGEDYYGVFARSTPVLPQSVFNSYDTEHGITRYIAYLAKKDFTLVDGMVPLGSCTMKLNSVTSLVALSWRNFANVHPFVPKSQSRGYQRICRDLEHWLAEITGLAMTSLQPNAGSQGEYSGLLAIRAYHESRGEPHRKVCLIPMSAHGTNPASAAMCGLQVVPVKCDQKGNISLADLQAKVEEHAANLACVMITYPSTHGVYEIGVREMCTLVHRHGGLVYMDGANLNAMVGVVKPGDVGVDVLHINLHKTFGIPHGGGGPGMGPICVARHLAPFLPTHIVESRHSEYAVGAVSSAAYGSALILLIPWMYIRMMGPDGLKKATQVAILNANYIAKRVGEKIPVLYRGASGLVAHECIFDLRDWDALHVTIGQIVNRLIDYGFHQPTVSFPVHGSTLMAEPTESESREELDLLCAALLAIYRELNQIKDGLSLEGSPLYYAPHTLEEVCSNDWDRPYPREVGAFPMGAESKRYWPTVTRVNDAQGDRVPICNCEM